MKQLADLPKEEFNDYKAQQKDKDKPEVHRNATQPEIFQQLLPGDRHGVWWGLWSDEFISSAFTFDDF